MSLIEKLREALQQRQSEAAETAEELAVAVYRNEAVEPARAETVLRNAGKNLDWLESRVAWLQSRRRLQDQIDAGQAAKERLAEIAETIETSRKKLVAEQRRHDAVVAGFSAEQTELSHAQTTAVDAGRRLSSMPDPDDKAKDDELGRQMQELDAQLEQAKRQHRPPEEVRVLTDRRDELSEQRAALRREMAEVI